MPTESTCVHSVRIISNTSASMRSGVLRTKRNEHLADPCANQCGSNDRRFKSTITIWKAEEKFSAASLLEVLTANLDCGALRP